MIIDTLDDTMILSFGPVARANLSGGHCGPHPNIIGPPGILGLFISGSK